MARRRIVVCAALVWVLLVGVGGREIYGYATTEGARDSTPAHWPSDSTLARVPGQPTLVMFVHPDCPCSRASLRELQAIHRGAASIHVVFAGTGETWELAGRIDGATRVVELDGREAARFGAITSGHVVVYDAAGTLRYAGGITGSRGHTGDNIGRRTVERILAGSSELDTSHPVFGCVILPAGKLPAGKQ